MIVRAGSLVLLLALAGPAGAEEWPRFRGPRGDGISKDALAAEWPKKGLAEAWRAKAGEGYSSPIGYDGKVYLFSLVESSREVLTAYAADSGRVLWSESNEGGFSSSYPGTRATPTIDEADKVIYTYGGAGDLVRRDLATGKLAWRLDVLKETGAQNLQWGTASSPLLDGGNVYVQGGSGGPVAVAVHKADGKIAWRSAWTGDSGYATPILVEVGGRKQLIVFAGDALVSMDPATGATLWSQKWPTKYGVNAALPIVRGDELLVSSAYGSGALLVKIGPTGATKRWECRDFETRFNAPIVDGNLVIGNSEGTLRAIGWSDGEVRWSGKKSDFQMGGGGSIVRSGDKLVLLGDRGLLSLARATPAGVKKLADMQLLDGSENWSTPLVYRGRLYVKGPSALVALDLPAAK